YWASFSGESEANYITAVLNSAAVNLAIKPFQSTGLLGERDVTKKLLELPIPTYDHEDKTHVAVTELGKACAEEAAEATRSVEFPVGSSLARQRGFVRTHLEAELKHIDELVAKLLSS
ncbi:MAG: N-6 DNA methylase, partial [Blastocatellia bacterium]